ncbi:hypothetical protein K435DRAFT_966943 [Dendrothele bispora CBS 962.96]|uniref:DNA polymerase lambda n=1 Tax=Dendrothele bispora (strain CBS 962.96) TaxID=1314807 RepID=A0A4S8LX47_DENBC|nr:hypothetical protein K435DRAFT_966943 [Dendrothele bispora CBS 962.96]
MGRSQTAAKMFFREQEKRMNVSDDDMDDYYARRLPGQHKSRNEPTDDEQYTVINGSDGTRAFRSMLTDPSNDRVGLDSGKELQETSTRRTRLVPRKRKSSPNETGQSPKAKRNRRAGTPANASDSHNLASSVIVSEGPPTSPVSSPVRGAASRHTPPRKHQTEGDTLKEALLSNSQSNSANTPASDSAYQMSLPIGGNRNGKPASLSKVVQDTLLDVANENFTNATVYDDNSSVVAPSSPIENPSAFVPSASHSSGPVKAASTLLDSVRDAVMAHHAGRSDRSAARQHSAKKSRPKVRKLDTAVNEKSRDTDQSSIVSFSSARAETSLVPPVTSGKGKAVAKASSKTTATRTKTKKKQLPLNKNGKRPTTQEYVEMVMEKADKLRAQVPAYAQFLQGLKFFYFPGNMTVASESTIGKMDLMVKHGADLVAKYDSSVTQIIVETGINAQERSFLRAIGFRKLADIPHHIPTLTWQWIQDPLTNWLNHQVLNEGRSLEKLEVKMGNYWDFARFSQRIEAGVDPNDKPRKRVKQDKSLAEFSHISDFSIDINAALDGKADVNVTNPRLIAPLPQRQKSSLQVASSSRVPLDFYPQPVSRTPALDEDPLAEFYAQAKAECDERQSRWDKEDDETNTSDTNSETDDEEPAPMAPALVKRGWACDSKENQQSTCPNQDIIGKLEELMQIHKARPTTDDGWRAYSYTKAIRTLRSCPYRIKSYQDAVALPGVGHKTAEKIEEIIQTGELRRLQHELSSDGVHVQRLFTGIYGVGNSTATRWYNNGARTLEDLKAGKLGIKLSPVQEIGLRYYDDINSRMPRTEAQTIFEHIKPIALSIDRNLFVEIMGSYRRGKADCGDIDILITRNDADGKTHEGVLRRLLKRLHNADILTEDLAAPDEDDLETCYRGLCHIPGVEGARRRRIDFLTTTWKSRGAALLYYTGDDLFNRSMRLKANKMGYSLNQRGLWKDVIRNPSKRSEKLDKGTILASETEQEIFKVLGVPWQEPHERVRNFQ